jgi:hypothetical protein
MVQFVFDNIYISLENLKIAKKILAAALFCARKICASGMTWKARPGSGQNHFGSTALYITTVPVILCFHIYLSGTVPSLSTSDQCSLSLPANF